MTGEGEPTDSRERDEPLGDVAEKVRERRGSPDELRESADRSPREGPLSDVASEVDERRKRRRESTDPFESVDVGELDGEKLWEQLAAGEDGETITVSAEEAVPVEPGDAGEDRDVRTIPKETCHGCPHLGDPPELHCTHEGTDILAMPDADHFRVADCPMVVAGEEDVGSIVSSEVGEDESEVGEDGSEASQAGEARDEELADGPPGADGEADGVPE